MPSLYLSAIDHQTPSAISQPQNVTQPTTKLKMISTKMFLLRSVVRQKALISSSIRFRTITQAASAEKIQRIVNDISQLTLIEVAELNQVLKTTLKIPDAPVMAYGAGPAPGPVVAKEEEEEAPKAKAQTIFTVKLTKFDETKKIALIKEIKNTVEGMNLVQAKKFVETLPAVVRADIPKDEAEKLSTAIAAAGGICEIV